CLFKHWSKTILFVDCPVIYGQIIDDVTTIVIYICQFPHRLIFNNCWNQFDEFTFTTLLSPLLLNRLCGNNLLLIDDCYFFIFFILRYENDLSFLVFCLANNNMISLFTMRKNNVVNFNNICLI